MLKKRETGFEEGRVHQSIMMMDMDTIEIEHWHIEAYYIPGNILRRCQLPLCLCGLRIRALTFVFSPDVCFDYCKYIRLTTTKKKTLQFWRRTGLKLSKQLRKRHLLYIIEITEQLYSTNYWKHQLLSWIRRHFIVAASSSSDRWV